MLQREKGEETMDSRALKDYFRAFGFKELVTGDSALMYIYLLTVPMFSSDMLGSADTVHAAISIYYCGMIPWILGLIGMRLSPIGLPKVMFLCPMSKERRENYVRTRLWVRFFVPLFLFIVWRAVLWIVASVHVFYVLSDAMLALGLLGDSFATLTGRKVALESMKNQPRLLLEKEIKGVDTKGLISALLGLVGWILAFFGIADGGGIHMAIWVLAVFVLVCQILLSVKMLGCVTYLVPLACDYERMND